MSPLIRVTIWAALGLLLAACDLNRVTTVVRVELESPTPAEAAQAAVVLQNRLAELLSRFSKVTATASGSGSGSGVDVVFTGEAPPDELIRSLVSQQGAMRMFLMDSPINVVVTDRDVEQAAASMGDSGPVINLRLTHAAGERMLAFTRRSIGKVMVTSWDRKQETRAVISGVFGQYLQTTGLDVQTVKLWVLLLGHGRLPVTVRSVEIRHPTAP